MPFPARLPGKGAGFVRGQRDTRRECGQDTLLGFSRKEMSEAE